jgi:hypothetical protein
MVIQDEDKEDVCESFGLARARTSFCPHQQNVSMTTIHIRLHASYLSEISQLPSSSPLQRLYLFVIIKCRSLVLTLSNNYQLMPVNLSSFSACLARSSPDVASISWLVVNILCLACSLHVAAFDFWTNSRQEEEEDTVEWDENAFVGDDDYFDDYNIAEAAAVVSPSGRATLEYLLWSLGTTIVWIVEVTLRTAFPLLQKQSPGGNDNLSKNDSVDEKSRVYQTQAQQQEPPQEIFPAGGRRRTSMLVLELMLAIFFLVESVLDCLHWKALIKEDDVLGEEVDIWISILGYLYMTYETFKAAAAKRSFQRVSAWNGGANATNTTGASMLSKQESTPYINMTTISDGELFESNVHHGRCRSNEI